MKQPLFVGGENISLRVPLNLFVQAVEFYEATLGLEVLQLDATSCVVRYGPIRLWLDCCEGIDRCEMRLEVKTPNTTLAAAHLRQFGVQELKAEPLSERYDGFWIRSPLDEVVLVSATSE